MRFARAGSWSASAGEDRAVSPSSAAKESGVGIVGVDVSDDELKHNEDVDERIVADVVQGLPFDDGSVDMIVSQVGCRTPRRLLKRSFTVRSTLSEAAWILHSPLAVEIPRRLHLSTERSQTLSPARSAAARSPLAADIASRTFCNPLLATGIQVHFIIGFFFFFGGSSASSGPPTVHSTSFLQLPVSLTPSACTLCPSNTGVIAATILVCRPDPGRAAASGARFGAPSHVFGTTRRKTAFRARRACGKCEAAYEANRSAIRPPNAFPGWIISSARSW